MVEPMSGISTHILDTSRGTPAPGISVSLERSAGKQWEAIGGGDTDAHGRLRDLGFSDVGTYRLTFLTGPYFESLGVTSFYPHVVVVFQIASSEESYHVPLLISPFGYST